MKIVWMNMKNVWMNMINVWMNMKNVWMNMKNVLMNMKNVWIANNVIFTNIDCFLFLQVSTVSYFSIQNINSGKVIYMYFGSLID